MAGEQAGTVRDVQEESGSEWNFVLRVGGGRGWKARYPARDYTMCQDTKEHDRAHSKHHASARHRFTRAALGDRPIPEWNRKDARPVRYLRAVQLCDRSAKHACSQVCASVGSLRKSHEANNSITEISLSKNNIGDGGAIALAESLKATLLTCFRLVRAMLSVWPAGP